jgi:hypothetical protein
MQPRASAMMKQGHGVAQGQVSQESCEFFAADFQPGELYSCDKKRGGELARPGQPSGCPAWLDFAPHAGCEGVDGLA